MNVYAQMAVRSCIKYLMRFRTIATDTNNFSTSFLELLIRVTERTGLHLLFGSTGGSHSCM